MVSRKIAFGAEYGMAEAVANLLNHGKFLPKNSRMEDIPLPRCKGMIAALQQAAGLRRKLVQSGLTGIS